MLKIIFKSAAAAKKVYNDVKNNFDHFASMSVTDFCRYLKLRHSDSLWYPPQVDAMNEYWGGMKWYRNDVIFIPEGDTFLISEPKMTRDISENGINKYLPENLKTNKKEEKSMYIDITGVNSYNDRVVIVRYSDGTFTKSVCSEKDKFDLDIGISLCVLKKFLADKSNITYPTLIRKIHKMIELKEKDRKQALADKAERRKLQEERHQRNIARAAKKAKEVYGGMIREAVMDAMKEDDE